ncbi:urease accessory protein UreF [Hyphomicrobium sp. MC1]|nr:urease accessory protein UreF [Hyphomicrobium sp. MC1]
MTTITAMDDVSERQHKIGGELSSQDASTPVVKEDKSSDAAAKLLIWLSPAFPVGSFAFSHGLEWAVQAGQVRNVATVIAWLDALLEYGGLRNDAIFAAHAWHAAMVRDARALIEVNELALAMAGSKERYLETTAQGNAFVTIIREAWRAQDFDWGIASVRGDVAYPVAVGLTGAAHEISRHEMLRCFVLAQVQNLVSAVIRLSVIGHTDGQHAIASLLPAIGRLVLVAETATLDDIGGAAFQSDIAALRHETQYSRLFRS